jgi:peptidoglycan/LPS O-acetylase OafA/YrhL
VLPHPETMAATAMATPDSINSARFPRKFMGKRLIQIFPAYLVIVNQ